MNESNLNEGNTEQFLSNAVQAVLNDNRFETRGHVESFVAENKNSASAWLIQAWTCDSLAECQASIERALHLEPENEVALAASKWFSGIRSFAEGYAEAERLEAERLDQERLEQERLEAERLEAERLEAERLQQERLQQERMEQERLEQERLEAERLEAERLEQERLEQERLEQERLEAEHLEAERLEAEQLEQERLDAERFEQERMEQERLDAERFEQERMEQERLDADRLEAERFEAEQREAQRHEHEKMEIERLEQERLESERLHRMEQEGSDSEQLDFDETQTVSNLNQLQSMSTAQEQPQTQESQAVDSAEQEAPACDSTEDNSELMSVAPDWLQLDDWKPEGLVQDQTQDSIESHLANEEEIRDVSAAIDVDAVVEMVRAANIADSADVPESNQQETGLEDSSMELESPETGISADETEVQSPETESLEAETHLPETEMHSPEAGIELHSLEAELETHTPEMEMHSLETEMHSPEVETHPHELETRSDELTVEMSSPEMGSEMPESFSDSTVDEEALALPNMEEEEKLQECVDSLVNEVQQVMATPQAPPAETAPVQSNKKPLVLTVDDSATIRKLVSLTLREQGYEVVSAADGIEALNILAERLPDLILSDINMPRMGGYKLCKFIKKHERTASIPVIMLSGKDGVFDKMRGKLSGCDGFIGKPFETKDLLSTVQGFLPIKTS